MRVHASALNPNPLSSPHRRHHSAGERRQEVDPRMPAHSAPNPTPLLLVAAGATTLPVNDGRKWTQEEVQERVKMVEDPVFLKERLGLDKVGCGGAKGKWL